MALLDIKGQFPLLCFVAGDLAMILAQGWRAVLGAVVQNPLATICLVTGNRALDGRVVELEMRLNTRSRGTEG